VKIVRPVFYGYVFVCIDHIGGQRCDQITELEKVERIGVAGFLKGVGAEQPRMMRPWYVERLRLMEDFGLFDSRLRTSRALAEGELIWIVGGEFRDHFAQVLRVKPGEKRVQLLLEAMNADDDGVSVDVQDVRAVWTGSNEPMIDERGSNVRGLRERANHGALASRRSADGQRALAATCSLGRRDRPEDVKAIASDPGAKAKPCP
jgi:hypothetical protein